MTLAIFLEQIINGLIIGSMYALIGSGISLIYGTMRVLNLAHGEFYMLGGYFVFYLAVTYGLPAYVAIPLAVVATFILGWLTPGLLADGAGDTWTYMAPGLLLLASLTVKGVMDRRQGVSFTNRLRVRFGTRTGGAPMRPTDPKDTAT